MLQGLLANQNTRIVTRTSLADAASLGYSSEEMIVQRVRLLNPSDFYKSMESHGNHLLWQDVYRAYEDGDPDHLYIKLQMSTDGKAVVISFKKDTGGVL